MVVYAGLPPAIQSGRKSAIRKTSSCIGWLQWIHGRDEDGAPTEEGHYKANVDVMMAIDALELSVEMSPMWSFL